MKISYTNIIKDIEENIEKIISQLKINRSEKILEMKHEYINAVNWLRKGELHQINPKSHFVVLPHPLTDTPSSEFRIIEDHESDNRTQWKEINFEGKKIRPNSDDILIIKKLIE